MYLMSKRMSGFTVIEVVIVVVLLGLASVLFFIQKNNVEVSAKDDSRKSSVNAMYYSLEEVFYGQNKYYPASISAQVLPSVDPDLFTDPSGFLIGESDSDYRYEPTGCVDGKCKTYTLRATLENEADYIKTNK